MSKYKLIQLTNTNIGEIEAESFLPLGKVTRRLNANCNLDTPFQVASSNSDIIYITEPGYYKVTYSISLAAAAAGVAAVNLVVNDTAVYTVSETIAAANDVTDLTIVYVIRVCPNCCGSPYNCPAALQLQLGDVASSATVDSTANLIIEKLA
jgi:hypothetical protein